MNLVTVKCVVCNGDFSSPLENDCENSQSLHSLIQDLWNLFCKLFKVSQRQSAQVIQFYLDGKQPIMPFCPVCRDNVCRLFVLREKIKSFEKKTKKIMTIVTQTIIESSSTNHNTKSSLDHRLETESTNLVLFNKDKNLCPENHNLENDTMINQKINCLRSNILKSFNPHVVLKDCGRQGRKEVEKNVFHLTANEQLTTTKMDIPLESSHHNNNSNPSPPPPSSPDLKNHIQKIKEEPMTVEDDYEKFYYNSMDTHKDDDDPLAVPTQCKRMRMADETYQIDPRPVHHETVNFDHEFEPDGNFEVMDHKSMEEFVRAFKAKRTKLGVSQCEMGVHLRKLYNVDLSQTTMSRFEALNLSFPNMCKLQPVFEKWMEDVGEEELRRKSSSPFDPSAFTGRRRKRTFFDEHVATILKKYFRQNPTPNPAQLDELANDLKLDREVVRVWFCNRRQLVRRKTVTNPPPPSSAVVSPNPSPSNNPPTALVGLTSNLSRSFFGLLLDTPSSVPHDPVPTDLDDTIFSWSSSRPSSSSSSTFIKMEHSSD